MGFIRRMNRTREDGTGSWLSNQRVQSQHHESPAPPAPKVTSDEDAMRFLQFVMHEFTGEVYKYEQFIDILCEFRRGSICKEDLIGRVKVLFQGHPALILGFNEFLPAGYKINIQDGEAS